MVVALALSVVLSQAIPVDAPLAQAPLISAEPDVMITVTRAPNTETMSVSRTASEVLFWTGMGVLAGGVYLIVQSVNGPVPLRPTFNNQAIISCSTAIGLISGGLGIGFFAGED